MKRTTPAKRKGPGQAGPALREAIPQGWGFAPTNVSGKRAPPVIVSDARVLPEHYTLWAPVSATEHLRFRCALYEPQAIKMQIEDGMVAREFYIDGELGAAVLTIPAGRLGIEIEGWSEHAQIAGARNYYGEAAHALMALLALKRHARQRKRGERGKGITNLDAREFLLAEALVLVSHDYRQRPAAAAVIEKYDGSGIIPWPMHSAENDLWMMMKRYLSKDRRPS